MTIKMTIKKNIKISIWIFVILMLSVLSIMQPLSNADNMKENLANNTRGASIGLEEIVEREYFIKDVYSGRYLDVKDGKAADGTNVQQYEYNGTDSQRWMISLRPNTSNEVYIMTRLGNDGEHYVYSLDINGASSSDGANAQIYYYNESSAQIFTLALNSDFTFLIRPKCSNFNNSISLEKESCSNGGNVVQKSNNTSDPRQCWILEPVERDSNFGVKYALANYNNHIETYPNFEAWGGDCTNYVSQCLLAEGIHMHENWYIYKKNNWNPTPDSTVKLRLSWDVGDTLPWINADDFKWFWGSGKTKATGIKTDEINSDFQWVDNEADLNVGDVIQLAKIENNTLGTAYHSMYVSSIKNNVYYISSHTNPTESKSIVDVARDNRGKYMIFYKY